MARITKIELEQKIQAQAQELIALRARISVLEGENALLKAKPVKASTSANDDDQPVQIYTNRAGVRMGKFRIGHNTFAHRAI